MEIKIKYDCDSVDWSVITETLKTVGMAHFSPEIHEKAFRNSYVSVFMYDGDKLAGFGRAISDGVYQAAVYDIAVTPDYQSKGLGARIIKAILERLPDCNVILYASPGKEGFYEKYGFRKMRTGMAAFTNEAKMIEKGFIE